MRKSIFPMVAMMMVLTMLSFNANLTAAKTDVKKIKTKPPKCNIVGCSKTSDKTIVSLIKGKLQRNLKIGKQINNIHISSKNKVVTIRGWVTGKGAKLAITRLVLRTKCIRRIINKLNGLTTFACGRCMKPCGNTCIDICDWCNRKVNKCGVGQKLFKGGCVDKLHPLGCPICKRKSHRHYGKKRRSI